MFHWTLLTPPVRVGARSPLRSLAGAVLLLGAPAAADDAVNAPPAARPAFVLGEELEGDSGRSGATAPFDMVVADMDLDGDDDLIASRHFFGIVLYENDRGRLTLLNGPRRDQAGLDVPPGVRIVHAGAGLLDQVGAPAIVVSSVRTGHGDLKLEVQARRRGRGPSILRVACSDEIEVVEGPDDSWQRRSATELDIRLPAKDERLSLRIRPKERTPHWTLSQHQDDDKPSRRPLPFRVGGDLDQLDGDTLRFWSQDPHGMAWAQVDGSPEPDLVVVRGGSRGRLQDLGIDKDHLVYRYVGRANARFQPVTGLLPPDPGRGRGAAWVDVDNDGRPELYLTNRDGLPSLLFFDPAQGRYQDRAASVGLDAVCSELGAWVDVDDDGWQDLVSICQEGLFVAHNLGVGAFRIVPGDQLGLPPDVGGPPAKGWLREDAIQVLDIDGDDRLDLWLAGVGKERRHRVLLGQPDGGFVDATQRLGLADAQGVRDLRPVDADMDGYEDALVQDGSLALLWNRGGQGFERIELAQLADQLGGIDPTKATGLGLDLDDDDRTDLVVAGGEWRVLTNTTPGPARSLQVRLDSGERPPPVGTLLRARYADGHTRRIRFGSHASSALSQSLSTIPVALPAPGALQSLQVRWPGRTTWQDVPVPADATLVVIPVPPAQVWEDSAAAPQP